MLKRITYRCLLFLVAFFGIGSAQAQMMVSVTNVKDACDATNNGSFDVTVTGSTGTIVMNIFGPPNQAGLMPLDGVPFPVTGLAPRGAPLSYTVVVQDDLETVVSFQAIENVTPDMTVAAEPGFPMDNTDCAAPNGAISISVSGGTGSFSYSWTGPGVFTSTSEDISMLVGGTYTVVVSDDGTNCSRTEMFTITDPLPSLFNVITGSPLDVCDGDDAVIQIDGNQSGIDYTIHVNGIANVASTVTGDGSPPPLSLTLTSASFVDSDILTVVAVDGMCPPLLMTGSVTVNLLSDPTAQNITTADPLDVCTGDDAVIDLDGSEVGVTYEILVNGVPSGTTAPAGAAISITLPSASFADTDVLTVEGQLGVCTTPMTGSVTINLLPDPVAYNITTASPQLVCSGDDVTLDLDNSDAGTTYEILVNGVPSGTTAPGIAGPLSITLPSASFADTDVLTIEGQIGTCATPMTGSVTISLLPDPTAQNITTADPLDVCTGDDAVIDLDGSEVGVTYEILVNGVPSGTTARARVPR